MFNHFVIEKHLDIFTKQVRKAFTVSRVFFWILTKFKAHWFFSEYSIGSRKVVLSEVISVKVFENI